MGLGVGIFSEILNAYDWPIIKPSRVPLGTITIDVDYLLFGQSSAK